MLNTRDPLLAPPAMGTSPIAAQHADEHEDGERPRRIGRAIAVIALVVAVITATVITTAVLYSPSPSSPSSSSNSLPHYHPGFPHSLSRHRPAQGRRWALANISNAAPRLDVAGFIMDVHDGQLVYHNGTYYYFGAEYGLCREPDGDTGCAGDGPWGTRCGFRTDHNVSLFTSPDMQTWTPAPQPVFQMLRDFPVPAIMFSPKVIYNYLTSRWVLWLNWNPETPAGGLYAVAVSASPFGPFKVVNQRVQTLVEAEPSDSQLWQDDETGVGYIIYSGQFVVSIEQLTPDFTSTLGSNATSGPIGEYSVEAPAMFRRNGTYYAVFGQLCCYCREGTARLTVYTACHPLGPYNATTVIGDAVPAQSTDITRYFDAEGRAQFMYRGDRWQQAPDQLKGHDPTAMAVLQFDHRGHVKPLQYLDDFLITVSLENEEGYRDADGACRAQ